MKLFLIAAIASALIVAAPAIAAPVDPAPTQAEATAKIAAVAKGPPAQPSLAPPAPPPCTVDRYAFIISAAQAPQLLAVLADQDMGWKERSAIMPSLLSSALAQFQAQCHGPALVIPKK